MDLETVSINNILVPLLRYYFVGIMGKKPIVIFYYLTNKFQDLSKLVSEGCFACALEKYILNMIKQAMSDICIRKYKNYRIYLHNFSKFDGYFLIKYLAKLGYCDPIIHKGKIISCNFTFNDLKVTFLDSYLLLTSSLKKLCKSFNINDPKSIFPFLVNDINYNGVVPNYSLFDNISHLEYENYKENFKNKVWD